MFKRVLPDRIIITAEPQFLFRTQIKLDRFTEHFPHVDDLVKTENLPPPARAKIQCLLISKNQMAAGMGKLKKIKLVFPAAI